MSPPVKVVLLILAAVAHIVATQPPNPPPSKKDQVNNGTFFEKAPRVVSAMSQIFCIGCILAECAVTLALYFQNPQTSIILFSLCSASSPSISHLSALSNTFISGLIMMYTSALIRLWCYKALGTLFTYEITIRPNHKLITSGPYAYVRHPSYTASTLMMSGTAITCFCTGSYIDECEVMSTPARWIVRSWAMFLVYVVVSLLRRGKIEDEGLRKAFGETWDQYSRAVPCRFVPGLV